MNQPEELAELNALVKKIKEIDKGKDDRLSDDEVKYIKEVVSQWPHIQELLKERESWKGFLKIGRYLFWFIIGVFMLLTYIRENLPEGASPWR